MHEAFTFNTRLGVHVLREDIDFTTYSEQERKKVFSQWALMCATMTNRVADLEVEIMKKLDEMYEVNTADDMHEINNQMMELASVVCDLNILSRSVFSDLAKAHF